MLTLQQIFDTAATHLLAQGQRSGHYWQGHKAWSCEYRGPDGLKCAVGVFIPDNAYAPKFDKAQNSDVSSLVQVSPQFREALRAGGVDVHADGVLDLLVDLQGLHDDLDPEHWAQGLRNLAADRGLRFERIEELLP